MIILKGAVDPSQPDTFISFCVLSEGDPQPGELEYVIGTRNLARSDHLHYCMGPANEMLKYNEVARFRARSIEDANLMFAQFVARTFKNVERHRLQQYPHDTIFVSHSGRIEVSNTAVGKVLIKIGYPSASTAAELTREQCVLLAQILDKFSLTNL